MKFDIIQQIIKGLFAADMRRLNGTLVEINNQNKELTGSQLDGFLFRGKRLVPVQESLLMASRGESYPPVHKSLIPQVDAYLKDLAVTDAEKAQVQQTLGILLRHTTSLQHMRDALPDCVIQYVPVLKPISRFDEAAWTIKENAPWMRQYEKTLPLIESYAVANMIY